MDGLMASNGEEDRLEGVSGLPLALAAVMGAMAFTTVRW